MKIQHLVPPVAALLLAGAWNLALMRSVSTLEDERATLLGRIDAASESQGGQSTGSRRTARSEKAGADKTDWKSIAVAAFKDCSDGETRELIRFQRRLANMTPQEMADALDEIAGSGMSAKGRHRLECMIIQKLIAQDPALALNRFADRIGDRHGVGIFLTDAFATWAKTDVAAATEWFDREIAEGEFDLKSLDDLYDMRKAFEGTLMNHLLKTDAGLATLRISNLPDNQRAGVMKSIAIWDPSVEFCSAYGNIVRKLVPMDQQQECFTFVGEVLRADLEDSLSEVKRFLDHAQPTPAERNATLVAAGVQRFAHFSNNPSHVTSGLTAEMKQNFKDLAPEQADRLVGQALAGSTRQGDGVPFKDTAKAARQFVMTSGNDDMLVAFLDESFVGIDSNDEEKQQLMIELAGEIHDEVQRNRILARFESNGEQP